MGGLSLGAAPRYTGMAAMDMTGDPDMDRQILDARATQDYSTNRALTQERVASGELPADFVYGLPQGSPGTLEIGTNFAGERGPFYDVISYSTPEEYREAYNLKLQTPFDPSIFEKGGMSFGQWLATVASILMPAVAPTVAIATGLTSVLGSTAGSAVAGAGIGGTTAALTGEDVVQGALRGGIGGGVGGYMQGAQAVPSAAGGAGTAGGAGAGAAGTAGTAGVTGAGAAGAGASQFAGIPEIVVTASRPAFGAANLVAPAVGGLGAIGALGGTAPVPEIIPEVSPFETAGGEFVQTGGLQQSPVTTPSIDQTLTGTTTPAGTYDPATGLTGYIDQTGQFVQTASPLATPTGLELATGAAPAATIAQSPVFGVADAAAPTFGATGAMTAPVAGSVAGTSGIAGLSPQDLAMLSSLPGAGSPAPALNAVNAAAGGGALAAAGQYLGNVGSSLASSVTGAFAPDKVADLILRGAGMLAIDALAGGPDGSSALAGLSEEEQGLVLDMRDELARTQQEDENLFNQRLQQAYALIGDVDYFDPEYFGLQSARRAQLQAARAKQAGLRGLTGEERAAEARRYDLETGRSTGTAYDVGYGTGLEARTRARQAGIEALPTSYPSALSDYLSLQDIYRGGSARAALAGSARRQSTADLFGGLFGAQDEQTTGA